mmetsp:Transcript_30744/g.55952  ORF Transcript_30744/g.55952 Transcript_30744/m.55952 type:complete len:170 (+) Transcript_30744:218-727(+)
MTGDSSTGPKSGGGWGRATFVFLRTISAFYVFSKYGIFVSKVSGPSMWPTFLGRQDFVLAEALTPLLDGLQPGDVVISARPADPRESVIKRVAALPGGEVVLRPDRDHARPRVVQVPRGHVWLQGDNESNSIDSRHYGPVPLAMIRGRVFLQLWPHVRWVDREGGGAIF